MRYQRGKDGAIWQLNSKEGLGIFFSVCEGVAEERRGGGAVEGRTDIVGGIVKGGVMPGSIGNA